MVEVSNNVLAGLFLIALVVTVIGVASIYTFPGFTGFATTQSGYANVTIGDEPSITLTQQVTNFGDGAISPGAITNISTEQENTNGFNNGSYYNGTDFGSDVEGEGFAYPMIIEADGNVAVSVTVASNITVNSFMNCLGGTCDQPEHLGFKALDDEAGSCTGTLWDNNATADWWEVSTAARQICSQLDNDDGADTLQVHFKLSIPSDAQSGLKLIGITFEAAQA